MDKQTGVLVLSGGRFPSGDLPSLLKRGDFAAATVHWKVLLNCKDNRNTLHGRSYFVQWFSVFMQETLQSNGASGQIIKFISIPLTAFSIF